MKTLQISTKQGCARRYWAQAYAFTAFLVSSLAFSPIVQAEDTEIYTGATSFVSNVMPNVTFIIDTSGSMNTDVTMALGSYDPATTYTGTCDPTRIYYSSTGSAPDCSTSDYIDATSNTCKASETPLASGGVGFYEGRAAQYRARKWGNRWDDLSNHTDLVECRDDYAIHGETDASTNLYPADADAGGPWRADAGSGKIRAINWNNTGRTYTFYNANYLNWRNGTSGGTITKTRLEIVQEVFSNLMDSIRNINIAVMRYDDKSGTDNKGGYFVKEMTTLTDANSGDFKTAVNGLNAQGNTPLAETLYESYLYYKGGDVKFGNSTSPGTNVSGVLDPGDSSKYASPIEFQCQKNFVVLLTDGDPTNDTDADSDIEALPGFSAVTGANQCSGDCLDELAQYMNRKDCSSTLDDTQNVITYTIGFNTNQTLLNDAANKGGGKYYTADDTAGLTDVFTSIITDILAINTTFIAPAVSVNAFNRFNHRDELYYALFKPNSRPKWNGNIKRFRLAGDPAEIVDFNGDLAIDNNTGFFKSTATSFWTPAADAPDGDEVKKGGAASMLALPRTIYTYTGSTAPSNENLTDAANALDESNTAITKTMLGYPAMTDAERTIILQWARGVDVFDDDADGDDTDIRRLYGDPLHAKPLLITYGGTDANPDITLFAGTNEGQLVAIDTYDGSETFTFVPQELLGNLVTLFTDLATNDHVYGLDGPLTSWFNDVNGNGILYDGTNTLESGEFVYLYQGMRRGGKNYYAFDVTDRSAPVLKWMIEGGTGVFNELAQTWSAATHGKIKINGTEKNVLFFGGGYDVGQDSKSTPGNGTEGRAIFIVDADTGAKLWQAGESGTGDASGNDPDLVIPEMTNSIPSDLTVIDIDGDGYEDLIYAADMRGQIFRIDIDNDNTGASTLATGGVIAQLGGNGNADNRRFYYAPDVSLAKDRSHLVIAIGSGYRAHPLNTDIHDAFYVIHDPNVSGPALDGNGDPVYTPITMSDLYDATDNIIAEGTTAEISTAKAALAASQGFYIWLNENDGSFIGEKVLAKSLTFNGMIIFTTYKPVAGSLGSCSPSQGSAAAYLISANDGTPLKDYDLSGGDLFTRDDRRINLVRGGIPPEPSIIFHENGPIILIGTEKGPDPDLNTSPKKIYWHAE